MVALPQIAALGGSQAFSTLCGFTATVLWARMMPQVDFGQYRLALGIVSVAGAFSLMGLAQVAVMSAAKAKDGNLAAIVRTKSIGNLIGSLIILAAAVYYFLNGSIGFATALIAAAVLFPISNLSDIWINWFIGKSWFRSLASGRIVQGMLPVLAVGLALAVGTHPVLLVLLVTMGGAGLISVFMLQFAFRRLSTEYRDKSLNALGRHHTLALGFTAVVPLDVLVLDYWYSASEVAVYAIAVSLPLTLKIAFSVFSQFLAPKIYSASRIQDAWNSLRLPLLALALVFSAIGILGFFYLGDVMPLLFSDRYAASIEPARWLWLATCVMGTSRLLEPVLLGTKKPFFVYAANVGYPLLYLIFFIALGSFGVIGFVIARIVAMLSLATFFCASFAVLLKKEKRRSENIQAERHLHGVIREPTLHRGAHPDPKDPS